MKYCPNCGFKLAADYKVCPNCGYQLNASLADKKSAQSGNKQEQHLSRVQSHQDTRLKQHNSIIQYLMWLKSNPISFLLVVLLVILTYIYVGKIISFIVALVMLIWGYVFTNRQATPLDKKIKAMFRHVEYEEQTKVQRVIKPQPQIKRQQPRPVVIERPVQKYQPAKTTGQRSWIVMILAIITWSTSFWPGFFANNLLGTAIGWNSPTVPSLAQMIRQGIMYLNFTFHLQINPSLGLWLLALGPIIILLGSLMPSYFGRKLAFRGAVISAVIYFGGLAVLKIALDWGSHYAQLPPLALGSSGYAALFCIILLLVFTIVARLRH